MRVLSLYLCLELWALAYAAVVLPHVSPDRRSIDVGSTVDAHRDRDPTSEPELLPRFISHSPFCPSKWFRIARDLRDMFLTDGQCNRFARQTIRIAFHDCGSWQRSLGDTGGCDGSIALEEELSRFENKQLRDPVGQLRGLATKYGVSVADMIQFGAATAVKSCPKGPLVQTFVGRVDASTPNPPDLLPPSDMRGDALVKLLADKGFGVREFVALLGAHSVAKTSLASGFPGFDSTPGTLDVRYYNETLHGTAPFVLQADKNLLDVPSARREYVRFAHSQMSFGFEFSKAMTKMSLMGVDRRRLTDCTIALIGL